MFDDVVVNDNQKHLNTNEEMPIIQQKIFIHPESKKRYEPIMNRKE